MQTSDALLRAIINRLTARLGQSLTDTAAGLAVIVQDTPERLRRELELFREEVEAEAERLQRQEPDASPAPEPPPRTSPADLQDQVDQVRACIAELSRGLEGHP
ncbi:hypothetical protein OMCYN_00827 [cyanobiont of Ornithocercus magnificus]|nr:hypothetical protein OMCYN_00827 [cyanobiont of Ornithocercus magnificus]